MTTEKNFAQAFQNLRGKKIILGATGGIAVFKTVDLASKLRQCGADVHVIMTKHAKEFITELTFREISGNPVVSDMFAPVTQWNVAHISLATMADAFLIAPATANFLGKVAHGIADDMLTTTILATKAPIFLAPSMNVNMYLNPIVQENMKFLAAHGFHVIEAASGHLGCGTEGVGRLPEPLELVKILNDFFAQTSENLENSGKKSLLGKKVLVTAGGTLEPIDPVRYIGNRSSGKMGYAMAEEAAERGAEVILVSGPTALARPKNVKEFIQIETAKQMMDAVLKVSDSCDIIVKAAAVADFRAKEIAPQKIKKQADVNEWTIELEKNPDILFALGQRKPQGQILIGFAAETQNLLEYAQTKMKKKNLDFVIANDVSQKNAGFNVSTNRVKLLKKNGDVVDFDLMEKRELAKKLFDEILEGEAIV